MDAAPFRPRVHAGYDMTVLVVEDEADVRGAVVEVLESEGHTVVEAANGQEALRRLSESRPALVLLDLMMPVMNGWQVLEALRRDEALHSLPVVIMTAAHQRPPEGAAFLRKPFTLEELVVTVERSSAPPPPGGAEP